MRLTPVPARAYAVAVTAILVTAVPMLRGAPPRQTPRTGEPARFEAIATLVSDAIAARALPGAVVLVGRGDDVVYKAAFGRRAVLPEPEAMTEDTIFDIASLTKVVATTTSVMQLVEQGRVRLSDPVASFITGFERYGKGAITIRDLMTHVSGLRPDLELDVEFSGEDEAIRRAIEEVPIARPGERFVYSDINFFLLGAVIERASGERLDQYAAAHLFGPLGMRDTMFLPPASLRPRIAPTERCTALGWSCDRPDVPFLRGIVHDPTARRMGGVAGHAGVFSTAADLSRFCRMLLHGGELDGVRILSSLTVARMTSPSTPRGMADVRGLGWDIDSLYSANRGELFSTGSFGHTGWTGTSLWIDPRSNSYVVFLSNRVHPDGKGDVTPLRGKVATVAAAALGAAADLATLPRDGFAPAPRAPQHIVHEVGTAVQAGIDVLAASQFAQLRGKRVALLTNQTGRTQSGASTIDALAAAKGVTLVSLFSPEHGIRGDVDASVRSTRDEKTGLPLYSLYGDTRRPTGVMLAGIDTIVVDLQDSGSRFYTFPATVAYVMEEAAKRNIAVVVCDRPDPIDGFSIEGPIQDQASIGFNGYVPMPIRHGLTIGELAKFINGERQIGADLTVIPMKGWRRAAWYDETGLAWANPSPNIRTMNAETLYPGIGAIEQTNISVGRGTPSPFEQIGAPWIDGVALAAALNERRLAGVRFYPVTFTPDAGEKFGNEPCHGVFMIVTDRDQLRPVRVGLEIASVLTAHYGTQFKLEEAAYLFGSAAMLARVRAGESAAVIAESWHAGEEQWRRARARYLLY